MIFDQKLSAEIKAVCDGLTVGDVFRAWDALPKRDGDDLLRQASKVINEVTGAPGARDGDEGFFDLSFRGLTANLALWSITVMGGLAFMDATRGEGWPFTRENVLCVAVLMVAASLSVIGAMKGAPPRGVRYAPGGKRELEEMFKDRTGGHAKN